MYTISQMPGILLKMMLMGLVLLHSHPPLLSIVLVVLVLTCTINLFWVYKYDDDTAGIVVSQHSSSVGTFYKSIIEDESDEGDTGFLFQQTTGLMKMNYLIYRV